MKSVFLYIIVLSTAFAKGQKHDNIWPLGYYWNNQNMFYNLDFTNGNPDTIIYSRKMCVYITDAAVNDNNGFLQFYTNGVWVANNVHDTMSNSANFNPGWASDHYGYTGMGFQQSAIILPFNDTSQKYYLVYENAEEFKNKDSVFDTQPFELRYSIVDMEQDSGRGAIVAGFKNMQPIIDTLLLGRITACKHANGRDWWVVVHQYYSDMYYTLLFTPDTVMGPYTQNIGTSFPAKFNNGGDFDIFGMSCFSPDGNKYIMFGPTRTIEVLDFDRCTGVFSNARTVNVPINPGYWYGLGCSFSSDSRYIYANTYEAAYQYDSYASNIDSAGILIAVYDSFVNPFPTYFFVNQLAPDGKIYISTFGGSRILHVIENPDSAGLACNFNQHSFVLPQSWGGNNTLPNFPNYRLGRLVGSPCDTLTSLPENDFIDLKLKLTPNPNNGNFIVNYQLPQNKSGTLQIMDVMGKQVYSQALPQWSVMQRMNLPNVPAGVYIIKLTCGTNSSFEKFIKE